MAWGQRWKEAKAARLELQRKHAADMEQEVKWFDSPESRMIVKKLQDSRQYLDTYGEDWTRRIKQLGSAAQSLLTPSEREEIAENEVTRLINKTGGYTYGDMPPGKGLGSSIATVLGAFQVRVTSNDVWVRAAIAMGKEYDTLLEHGRIAEAARLAWAARSYLDRDLRHDAWLRA